MKRQRLDSALRREELLDGAEKSLRLFDVRHVTALVEDDQCSVKGTRTFLGRGERNGILASVHNQCRYTDGAEYRVGGQVIVSQTLPNRLLHATCDAKRSEVPRSARIRKVPGDAQLKAAVAICLEIALAKIRLIELFAQRLNLGASLTSGKLTLEIISVASSYRSWIDEHEPRRLDDHAICRCLACIQKSEEPAPGVPNKCERSNLELVDHPLEIANVSLPRDVALAIA